MSNVQLRRGLDPRQPRATERAPAKLSIQCPCGTAVTGATKQGLVEAYSLHRQLRHSEVASPSELRPPADTTNRA